MTQTYLQEHGMHIKRTTYQQTVITSSFMQTT